MDAKYGDLQLAQQLLERQGTQHCAAMTRYVEAECRLSPADLGLLLIALYPLMEGAVMLGSATFKLAGDLANSGAQALEETVETYVTADRVAHEEFARVAGKLGAPIRPFADPRDTAPVLGSPQSSAPPDHGDAEPWMFEQAVDQGRDWREYAEGTLGKAGDRIDGWRGSSAGVQERNDPSSYLVPPQAGNAAIEDMRWGAGPLLGGVDWVFEKFIGFSLLEDVIMKPFAGNWDKIDQASMAWENLGTAMLEMSGNVSGLPEQTETWRGEAADAFRAAMAALSAAYAGLSFACDYVSGLAGIVSTVAQAAAAAIGFALNTIVKHLLVLAAEASVPVAGWIAAGFHAGVIITDIVQGVRLIYTIVNLIYDAIYDFVESKQKLVDASFVLEDLIEYFARSASRAVTA